MSYHTHTPPGQTGQSDIPHTHTQSKMCEKVASVRMARPSHTHLTSLQSHISNPSCTYRNRISQKLPALSVNHLHSVLKTLLSLQITCFFAQCEDFQERQTGSLSQTHHNLVFQHTCKHTRVFKFKKNVKFQQIQLSLSCADLEMVTEFQTRSLAEMMNVAVK